MTDASFDSSWIRLRAVAADIKLHHSVFALPWAVLSMVLAGHRAGGLHGGQVVLILVCMVSARTVAMVANRVLDADVDAVNPRTARRAVPAGRVPAAFAWVVILAASAVFIAAAGGFYVWYRNPWPLILSVPVLVFLVGYSLTKRFTFLCHFYLGVALALAPVCAWVAIAGRISSPPVWMAAAVVFWLAGFDILYAAQDYAFDVAHRLFSIPAKIGVARALWVARAAHVVCVGLLVALGLTTPELHGLYFTGVAVAAALMVVEHSIVTPTDLSRLTLAFFTLNGIIGVVVGTLGVLDVLFR